MAKREPGIGAYKPDANGNTKKDRQGVPIWQMRFVLGTRDGQVVSHSGLFHGSYSEAKAEKKRLLKQFESNIDAARARQTFADYAQLWLAEHEHEVTPETFATDRRQAMTLCRHIGDVSVAEINTERVRQVLQTIRREGSRAPRKDGSIPPARPVGEATVNKFKYIMGAVLDCALEADAIAYNPVSRIKSKKQAAKDCTRCAIAADAMSRLNAALHDYEVESVSKFTATEERMQVIGHGDKPRARMHDVSGISYAIGVELALNCGMRQGEILALTWADVDLFGGIITVDKSQTQGGRIKTAKSANGVRQIPIDETFIAHLLDWKRLQVDALAKMRAVDLDAISDELDGLRVVCSGTFGGATCANFGHWWGDWRDSHGFEGLLLHELRHTYATHLLEAGLPPAEVARILGDNLQTVLTYYYDKLPKVDTRAANIIGMLRDGGSIEQAKQMIPA